MSVWQGQPAAPLTRWCLAAIIVVRLQTVAAREVPSHRNRGAHRRCLQAGTKSNAIPGSATLQLTLGTYSDTTLDAIRRIVTAESHASGSPPAPSSSCSIGPLTDNDIATTERAATALRASSPTAREWIPQQSTSEDFTDNPQRFGDPYTYWCIGRIDADTYHRAKEAGRVAQDTPVNDSATSAAIHQPTLDIGGPGAGRRSPCLARPLTTVIA